MKLPVGRGVLEHFPHQYAQTGANVLKALRNGRRHKPPRQRTYVENHERIRENNL